MPTWYASWQTSISLWLDSPTGWTRLPANEDESQAAINEIRKDVLSSIHVLAERRLITAHSPGWRTAFGFSGTGSSHERAREMNRIYDAAAPSITSVLDSTAQEFLHQIIQIVGDAVEEAGGSVDGIDKPASAAAAG